MLDRPFIRVFICVLAFLCTFIAADSTIATPNGACINVTTSQLKLQVVSGGGKANGTYASYIGAQIIFGYIQSEAHAYHFFNDRLETSNVPYYAGIFNIVGHGDHPIRDIFFASLHDSDNTPIACDIDSASCELTCSVTVNGHRYNKLYIYHDPNQYSMQLGRFDDDAKEYTAITVVTSPA